MPRKPDAKAQQTEVKTDVLAAAHTDMIEVANQATVVAEFVGYDMPYDKTRVVQEARFYMEQSASAMLEAGRRYLLLKENEEFGEFTRIVEKELGMDVRTVQLMMQATTKFLLNPSVAANAKTFSHLGKSKLFQLMTLDDQILEQLTSGGTVANLKLDAIETMSVRELKATIRTLKGDIEEKDGVLAAKDTRITKLGNQVDELQAKTATIVPITPDEETRRLRSDGAAILYDAEVMISNTMNNVFERLHDLPANNDSDFAQKNKKWMRDAVTLLSKHLDNLIEKFDLADDDLSWANMPGSNETGA